MLPMDSLPAPAAAPSATLLNGDVNAASDWANAEARVGAAHLLEREQDRGAVEHPLHREAVGEVRRRGPPLGDRGNNGAKVVIQQHDRGNLPRAARPALSHRDADIGRLLSGQNGASAAADRAALVRVLEDWTMRMALPSLSALGVAATDVDRIVANSRGSSMKTNPIVLTDDDIVIMSKAGRLSYRFPTAPGTSWTPMSVRLSASAGWVWNWNRPATQAQIAEVLAKFGLSRPLVVTGASSSRWSKTSATSRTPSPSTR